jgi:hypothetical protein
MVEEGGGTDFPVGRVMFTGPYGVLRMEPTVVACRAEGKPLPHT